MSDEEETEWEIILTLYAKNIAFIANSNEKSQVMVDKFGRTFVRMILKIYVRERKNEAF